MPDRIADEKKVVALMIRMYCRRHCRQQDRTDKTDAHHTTHGLCPECAALLDYALRRLDSCRFGNGKPSCRKCPVHCYRTHGHALGRPKNDIPPPPGRDKAPAARTPLPGTCKITLPCHYLPNYANFV